MEMEDGEGETEEENGGSSMKAKGFKTAMARK